MLKLAGEIADGAVLNYCVPPEYNEMAMDRLAAGAKKAGRSVRAGKSCGTLESGKWVGPAKSAAGGEVVAVNEDLVADPSIANDDPYEKGWLIILRPEDWDSVKGSLVAGSDVSGAYEAKMDAEGFGGCGG